MSATQRPDTRRNEHDSQERRAEQELNNGKKPNEEAATNKPRTYRVFHVGGDRARSVRQHVVRVGRRHLADAPARRDAAHTAQVGREHSRHSQQARVWALKMGRMGTSLDAAAYRMLVVEPETSAHTHHHHTSELTDRPWIRWQMGRSRAGERKQVSNGTHQRRNKRWSW